MDSITLSYIYGMDDQILKNILAIRKDLGLSQESMALELELAQSHYGKLERGLTNLTVNHLERIARIFKLRIIDIYTYPKKYVDPDKIVNSGINNDFEAVLQIKLPANKRDSVLTFLYGEQLTEILNK